MKKYLYGCYILISGIALFSSAAIKASEEAKIEDKAATDEGATTVVPIVQDVLTSQAIMQMLLGLALVVVVILLLAWLLRRVSNLHQSHQKMKIISSLSLGTRERAILIEVGDRQVLLGVAPGQISLLAAYAEKVITTEPPTEFAKTLKESIKEITNKKSTDHRGSE